MVGQSICPAAVVGWGPYVVAWTSCARCHKPLSRCPCDIPLEPAYITSWRLGVQTSVSGYGIVKSAQEIFGASPPRRINVLDLVDDEMVQAVKDEKESRG